MKDKYKKQIIMLRGNHETIYGRENFGSSWYNPLNNETKKIIDKFHTQLPSSAVTIIPKGTGFIYNLVLHGGCVYGSSSTSLSLGYLMGARNPIEEEDIMRSFYNKNNPLWNVFSETFPEGKINPQRNLGFCLGLTMVKLLQTRGFNNVIVAHEHVNESRFNKFVHIIMSTNAQLSEGANIGYIKGDACVGFFINGVFQHIKVQDLYNFFKNQLQITHF